MNHRISILVWTIPLNISLSISAQPNVLWRQLFSSVLFPLLEAGGNMLIGVCSHVNAGCIWILDIVFYICLGKQLDLCDLAGSVWDKTASTLLNWKLKLTHAHWQQICILRVILFILSKESLLLMSCIICEWTRLASNSHPLGCGPGHLGKDVSVHLNNFSFLGMAWREIYVFIAVFLCFLLFLNLQYYNSYSDKRVKLNFCSNWLLPSSHRWRHTVIICNIIPYRVMWFRCIDAGIEWLRIDLYIYNQEYLSTGQRQK